MTDNKNMGVLLEAFCKKNGIKSGGNFLHFLVEVGKAASALHLKEEKVIEAVSAIVGKGTNPMYICPSCDSNVLVEYGACPTCGVELVEGGIEKASAPATKKDSKAAKDAGDVIREKLSERPKMVVPPTPEDIKKMKLPELLFVAQSFEIEVNKDAKITEVRKAILDDLYGDEKATIKDITKKKNIKIENVDEDEIDDEGEEEEVDEEEEEKPAKKAAKKSSKKAAKKVEVEEDDSDDEEEEEKPAKKASKKAAKKVEVEEDEEEEEIDDDEFEEEEEEQDDDADSDDDDDNDGEEEEEEEVDDDEEEEEKPAKKVAKKASKKVEVDEDEEDEEEEEEQDDDDNDDDDGEEEEEELDEEEEEEEKPAKKSSKKVSENLDDAQSQRDSKKARLKELIVDFKANSKLVDKVEQKDLILILGMLGVKENVMKLDKKALAQKVKDVLKAKK